MPLPLVSIIGRPNVGKSTLFNRLAETKKAIVDETRGVTRDRSYQITSWRGTEFVLVDTGGIEIASQESDDFSSHIRASALQAIEESDALIFLVDGKTGITNEDENIAHIVKRANKPLFVVVNKLDNPGNQDELYAFYALGLGDPIAISSLHGYGTGDLLDILVGALPDFTQADVPQDAINVALVGRPNVGKSSLLNKLIGSHRSVVSDIAGTTRDSIDTYLRTDDAVIRLIDTAGISRHAERSHSIDYYAYVRALRSIDEADVCLLLIDALDGMVEQDQKIAQIAIERGCAVAFVINKWDLVAGDNRESEREHLASSIARRTQGMKWVPQLNISALTGKSADKVIPLITKLYAKLNKRITTSELNVFIQRIRKDHFTVADQKHMLTLYYATQTRTKPPTFTLFCNYPSLVNDTYRRFFEGQMRHAFDFEGIPLRFMFRKRKA